MTRLLKQGYKINRLSNAFKKFYGRHTDLVGQYKKSDGQMFADPISLNNFHFLWICRGWRVSCMRQITLTLFGAPGDYIY